ncbi:hypothetical protein GOB57_22260 [Sinorhizobium meliloti]|nr:hypothetical protein [Sinorhizobium meliloti]
MTAVKKIAKALDRMRVSLGGAMLGALSSNVLGSSTSIGASLKRDIVCAVIGFAVFMWVLADEARREAKRTANGLMELDPAASTAEKH